MQQVSLANKDSSDGTRTPALSSIAPRKAFVINLSASTTPVALTPPDHAGLKRFTFFVSRRREEGRERFRLHMGYFDTQEEAEKLLDIVREIYPGAWAGLSPGQRLRGGQAEAAATTPAPTATPTPSSAAAAPTPVVTAESAPIAPIAAVSDAPAPIMTATTAPPLTSGSIESTSFDDTSSLALLPDEGRRMSANSAAEIPIAASVAENDDDAATRALINVRSAIASLDDKSPIGPTLRNIPQLQPVQRVSATGVAPPTLSAAPAKASVHASATRTHQHAAAASTATSTSQTLSTSDATLNGQDALNVLEGRNQSATAQVHSNSASATMPMPHLQAPQADDSNARVDRAYFAVQLMWSVQPIDIAQVPQLAIFSAYTVYGAEGNRDGRRWYGLRLGFFTDAVSAKQVAHYVRSEFATVSVVPVTVRERERARLAVARPAATVTAKSAPVAKPVGGKFEFIEDKAPAVAAPSDPATARPGVARSNGRTAPGKRAKLRNASGNARVKAKSKPMTLEETLEILGAGQLQIDTDRTTVNDSGVRHLRLEAVKAKPSKLGRLFERLAERIGN